MQARGLWVGLAVVLMGGALNACGGSLGNPSGQGGSRDPVGRGGTTGSGGRAGAGGRGGGAAGANGEFGEPACLDTVVKGGACGPSDQQFCYKGCGPAGTGVKSETCTSGVYYEMSGCTFDPAKDYSCYRIPTGANLECPANSTGPSPVAGTPCDVAPCTVCNDSQGKPGGLYRDAAGAARIGYCVCQPPDANGARTWTCASDTAWPCGFLGCSDTGGGTGTGGAGGAGGDGFGEPACPSYVTSSAACTPSDIQFCYKTCGPEAVGVKGEQCTTDGTYVEMPGCSFDPSRDFSCYKIPTAVNAACPQGVTPQSSNPCEVPHCTLCNSLQGAVGGQYLDASGAPKVGWCVCKEPNATGLRLWSCASEMAWPCPLGYGC